MNIWDGSEKLTGSVEGKLGFPWGSELRLYLIWGEVMQ